MDNDFGMPQWMQGPQPKKRLSLKELQEERQRLVEIQRINKLKLQQREYAKQEQDAYYLERKQKIEAMKRVGGGIVGVLKAGHQKVSEFDKSRVNAKPIIDVPKKKSFKSIYD